MQFDETAPQSTKEQAAAEGDYEVLYFISLSLSEHQLQRQTLPRRSEECHQFEVEPSCELSCNSLSWDNYCSLKSEQSYCLGMRESLYALAIGVIMLLQTRSNCTVVSVLICSYFHLNKPNVYKSIFEVTKAILVFI